jgi:hypothetical protein
MADGTRAYSATEPNTTVATQDHAGPLKYSHAKVQEARD